MHASKRSRTLTASITAKVTSEEEKLVKSLARDAGVSPSEWCRRALLQAASCAPDTRLLLSEICALRAVFLTLQSETMNARKLTEEQVHQLIEKAERDKFTMADSRIHKYQSQALPPAATKLSPGAA